MICDIAVILDAKRELSHDLKIDIQSSKNLMSSMHSGQGQKAEFGLTIYLDTLSCTFGEADSVL